MNNGKKRSKMIEVKITVDRKPSDMPMWLSTVEGKVKDRYHHSYDSLYSALNSMPRFIGELSYYHLGWELPLKSIVHCEVDEDNAVVKVFRTTDKKPKITIELFEVEEKRGIFGI